MTTVESVPVGQMVTLIDEDGTILTTMLTDEEAKRTEIDPNMAHGLLIRARNELGLSTNIEQIQHPNIFDETLTVPEGNDPCAGDGVSSAEGSSFVWTHQMIVLMLNEYKKRKLKFRDSTQKKNKTWEEVAKAVRQKSKDAYFTGEACDRKFRNMISTYRKIKFNRNRSEKTMQTWRYFDIFEEMYANESDLVTKRTSMASKLIPKEAAALATVVMAAKQPHVSQKATKELSLLSSKINLPIIEREETVEFESKQSSSSVSTCSDYFGKRRRLSSYYSNPSRQRRRHRISEHHTAELMDKILVQQKEMMSRLEAMHAENMQLAKERNELLRILNDKFPRNPITDRVIPLPKNFVDYLLTDGIVLPKGSFKEPTYDVNSDNDDDNNDHDTNEVDWKNADLHEAEAPTFPELEDQIKFYIDELGGSVFPKLNWSAPKDAKWISATHTLQCNSIGEVILLLKSSDFIAHDLTQPFKDCTDWRPNDQDNPSLHVSYELVLRKWADINPGSEFRCFVKNDCLIAISQRDYCNFYEYIVSRQMHIVNDIVSFFREKVQGRFPIGNYVFDIHQVTKDCVELIDFNPFGVTTDALLFDWDELIHWNVNPNKEPEFRCVTSYSGIQPSPYRYYAMPIDFLDISTGQDPYKMRDLLQLMNANAEKVIYSSSESEYEDEKQAEEEIDESVNKDDIKQ